MGFRNYNSVQGEWLRLKGRQGIVCVDDVAMGGSKLN